MKHRTINEAMATRSTGAMARAAGALALAVAVLSPSAATAARFPETYWNPDATATGTETVGGVTTYTYTWHDATNWLYRYNSVNYRGDAVIPDGIGVLGWNGQYDPHDFGVRLDKAFETIGANTKININITGYVDHNLSGYCYPQFTGLKDAGNVPRITITVSETGHYDFIAEYSSYNDHIAYGAINLDIAGKWNSRSRGFNATDTRITLRGAGTFDYMSDNATAMSNLWTALGAGRINGVDGAGIGGATIATQIAGLGGVAALGDRLVLNPNYSGVGYIKISPTGDTNPRNIFFAVPNSITWVGGTTDWSVAGNWTGTGAPPNAAKAWAVFGNTGSTAIADLLNSATPGQGKDATVGMITFNGQVATTIQSTGTSPTGKLILDNGTGIDALVMVNHDSGTGNHTDTISAPLTLNSSLVAAVINSGDQLAMNGPIDGAGGVSLATNNLGKVALGGSNSYAGATKVLAGRLVLSGDNSAATGGMTISGGAAEFGAAASIPGTTQNVTVTSPGTVLFGASFDYSNIAGALSGRIVSSSTGAIASDNYADKNFDFATAGLTAASFGAIGNVSYTGTLTPNGTTYRLGGGGGTLTMSNSNAITGSGKSLVVSGNVILAANNDYTGVTTISSGGALSVSSLADAGSNSNLGAYATAGAGGVSLSGGTLQYTGSDMTTAIDRGFTLAATSTVYVNPASTALKLGACSLGAFTLNVTGGAGSSLALGATTLTGAATLNPTSADLSVASVSGVQNLTLSGTSTGNTVGAITTGAKTLTKSGTGTWTLSGINTYSSTTTVSGGVLRLNNASALGSGWLDISGGVLELQNPTTFTRNLGTSGAGNVRVGNNNTAGFSAFGSPVTINLTGAGVPDPIIWASTAGFNPNPLVLNAATADNSIEFQNNLNLNNATRTVQVNANVATLSGVISSTTPASGALTKTGAGTLVLIKANLYAGNTTVSTGKLLLGQGGSMDATAVSVTGTATYGMSYTSSDNTVQGGKTLNLANGTTLDLRDGNTNTLNFTTTANPLSGAKMYFDLGTTTDKYDKLTLTGAATLTNTNTLYFEATGGTIANGTYTIITAGSGLTGGTLTLGTTTLLGHTLSITSTPRTATAIYLDVTGGPAGYASWASANGLSPNPSDDSNNDGVTNGVAYFMNKTGLATNPGINSSGKVTWPNGGNIPSSAYGTQFVVQTSSDLQTWTDVLKTDPNLILIDPVVSPPTDGSVSYTLTGTSPRFVRLKVTPN